MLIQRSTVSQVFKKINLIKVIENKGKEHNYASLPITVSTKEPISEQD